MAALLALASSLLWGAGDFLGGRASRGRRVLQVLFWSQLAATVALWSVVGAGTAAGTFHPEPRQLAIAAAGGVAGVTALAAFYRALAIGPMSVVPPIAAAGVVLPVGVGLAAGVEATRLVVAGMVLAILGVVLASVGQGTAVDEAVPARVQPRTLGLCAVAAIGFGLVIVALDAAAGDEVKSAIVATAGVRAGSFGVLLIAVLVARTPLVGNGLTPRAFGGLAVIGFLDTGANLVFAMAAALGELHVVAILGSLYPAVTSALAHVVLGERAGRVQLFGVVLALVGVALLAGR